MPMPDTHVRANAPPHSTVTVTTVNTVNIPQALTRNVGTRQGRQYERENKRPHVRMHDSHLLTVAYR